MRMVRIAHVAAPAFEIEAKDDFSQRDRLATEIPNGSLVVSPEPGDRRGHDVSDPRQVSEGKSGSVTGGNNRLNLADKGKGNLIMGYSIWVHVEVEKIVRETDSAFLLQIDGETHWVPKSQIADFETYEEGDEDVTVSITEWIAQEKGLKGE